MKGLETRHLSVYIDRTPDQVYTFASNPENLPQWATGLSSIIQKIKGVWVAESPFGKIHIKFATQNPFGVLDHLVVAASGDEFHNVMRVVPNGAGSEVIFTLFRDPQMLKEKFIEDAKLVEKDLKSLKEILEKGDF